MSVSQCINEYLVLSKRVFGQSQNFTHREKFDPTALEDAIQDVVERTVGHRNALLMDATCCKTYG